MLSLQERIDELIEFVYPMCHLQNQQAQWETFIVTIKQSEVVAWSLDCLTCLEPTCPYIRKKSDHLPPGNQIQKGTE
jgi:hypothetical protein